MKAPTYFNSTPTRVTHRVSSSNTMAIPSTQARRPSPSKPAPLVQSGGCASCRKRRGG